MKKIIYLMTLLSIGFTGCNPNIDFSKIVPSHVDKFATGFISEIHLGNIDSCLTLVSTEMNNDHGKEFLTNTYSNIQTFSIDTFCIINAQKTSLLGDNGFTNYTIDYEYLVGNRYLYFTFGIKEQNNNLTITAFNGSIMEYSLSKVHAFSLMDKGFLNYLFLIFAVLIPFFIIVSLIFAIRTKLPKKWLWIIGIVFGFMKFSINWTTGQVGFSLINISILGAGFSKSGNIAPWTLSFSLPIIALIFWYKRYWIKREAETQEQLDEKNKTQEYQDENE